MLSRTSNNASSNNLRQSKSLTSVRERRKHPLIAEPLDPSTSRLHALIAAHKAMDRSHESTSASESLARADSNASKKSSTYHGKQGTHFQPALGFRRQGIASTTHSSYTNGDPQIQNYSHENTWSYDDSVPASEFGGNSENYGAEPSSYRRLRRAKSLLSPNRFGKYQHSSTASETRLSQAPTLRTAASTRSLHQSGVRLRLKRSLNLLRPAKSSINISTRPQQIENYRPESVVLARDQFLRGQQREHLKTKVSQLFLSKPRQEQKSFQRSLRSTIPVDKRAIDTSSSCGTESKLLKIRSTSTSLRKRLIKTFRKRQGSCLEIPPQQLDGLRPHFQEDAAASHDEAGFDSYHDTDIGAVGRGSLYVPTNQHPESCEEVDSLSQRLRLSASFESLRSSSRSRVTSWTNSTVTASGRGTPYERNRLSVIKEDGGPHQPSSSAGRHIGGVSTIQRPIPAHIGCEIDSQRIYSALVKRIDQEQLEMENTKRALEKINEAEERGDLAPLTCVPTIRVVQEPSLNRLNLSETISVATSLPSTNLSDNSEALADTQVTRDDGSKSMKNSPPQDSYSAFFPFSSECKFEAPSPFRKLLMEKRRRKEQSTINDDAVDSGSVLSRPRKPYALNTNVFGHSSESIYSRNTDGGTNAHFVSPVGSTDDFIQPSLDSHQNTGMATIMYPSYGKLASSMRDPIRLVTTTSATASEKGGWRGWAENQMIALTRQASKRDGHYREQTQISPENFPLSLDNYTIPLEENTGTDRGHTNQTLGEAEDILFREQSRPITANVDVNKAVLRTMPTNTGVAENSNSLIGIPDDDTIVKQIDKTRSTLNQQATSNRGPMNNTSRAVSSGGIAGLLRVRKSQSASVLQSDHNKENKQISNVNITPVSTPGRIQSRLKAGYCNEQPARTSGALNESRGGRPPDNGRISMEESPSEISRNTLSARLSRPFDMDVPESNRPFDSIYLGKKEPGVAKSKKGDRLSVAPNFRPLGKLKTYGDLSPMKSQDEPRSKKAAEGPDETALPAVPGDGHATVRSTSFTSVASGGKRMVSNFLRSRRRRMGSDDDQQSGERDSSMAFI